MSPTPPLPKGELRWTYTPAPDIWPELREDVRARQARLARRQSVIPRSLRTTRDLRGFLFFAGAVALALAIAALLGRM